MGYLSMGWSMEYHICFHIPKCSYWSVVLESSHVFALKWYFNAPFHVRMMYLSISSKKPDSLGKTVVKLIFLNSQMHVPKVFHLGMFV